MTIGFSEFMQSFENGFFDFLFNFISFLGEEYIFILVLGFLYWTFDKRLAELMAVTLAVSVASNNFLKELYDAKRPFEAFPNRITNKRPDTATGASFPSGHTQNFTAFLYSFGFLKGTKKIMIPITIAVILMGLSRVYLGVHFFEDVFAAIIFGVTIAVWMNILFDKYFNDTELLHRIYIGILIVFTVVLFFMKSEDFYKGYGILSGFILAIIVEKKYVNFGFEVSKLKKFYRLSLGLVIMISIQLGLKEVFILIFGGEEEVFMLMHLIRYFLIAFVGFGLYPMLFKKFNF